MLSEHLIFAISISILLYIIYRRKECFYIIIIGAYAPDIDLFLSLLLKKLGLITIIPIHHGDFHNLLVMLIFAILISFIFTKISINKAFLLSIIGFGAHLFEDALVYTTFYKFLFPIYNKPIGIGLFSNYKQHIDFFEIGNSGIMAIGIIMIAFSVGIYILSKRIYRINSN